MNKTRVLLVVVAIIAIVIIIMGILMSGVLQNPSSPQQTPGFKGKITIGALLPLTGQIASIALNMKNGIDLAVKEINAHGGINRTDGNYKLEVIYGDDRLDPQQGVAEIKRLMDSSVKVIIGAVSSSITLSCLQTVADNNVVLLSPASTYTGLTVDTSTGTPKRKCAYFFRDLPNDMIQGPRSAEAAKTSLGCTKTAIIYENNDYGIGLREEFKKKYSSLGGQIVGTPQSFDVGAIDFKSQVLASIGSSPQLIYIPGHYREIAMIIREARAQGFSGKILASEAYECDEVFSVGGSAVDGTYFMKPTTDLSRSYHQNFVTNYTNAYGRSPAAFSDFSYDAVVIAATAIHFSGNDGDAVKTYMNTHTFTNTVTRDITFDQYGDVKNADYSLYITKYDTKSFIPYP